MSAYDPKRTSMWTGLCRRIGFGVIEIAGDPVTSTGRHIVGMSNTVKDWKILEIKGANAVEACNIDAILVRIRASPVVRVDSAFRAEVMLSLPRIKLVQSE